MIASKRLIAFVIDMGFSIFSGAFVLLGLFKLMESIVNLVNVNGVNLTRSYDSIIATPAVGFSVLFFWAFGWPCLLWGFTISKFRRTLGKALLNLEVIDRDRSNLAFGRAIGRELLKMIPIMIPPLWIIPLLQAILVDTTYYDQVFGSRVVAKTKFSNVQDNFIQYYGKS